MSDLIERSAVIDLIDKYTQDMSTDYWTANYGIPSGVFEDEIMDLPSVQPERKWIPCSERLPEEGQKCLVCDKGSIGIDTYIGHGNPYNWKWYVRDYEAWLPLPEPYMKGVTK